MDDPGSGRRLKDSRNPVVKGPAGLLNPVE
jgi:hypothetical protein